MIVGISGYAQTGKDTVSNILVQEHGFTKIAWADKVRECALAVDPYIEVDEEWLPLDSEDTYYPAVHVRLSKLVSQDGWEQTKLKYPDCRRLLQRIGTEMGRNIIDPDLWVNLGMINAAPNTVFSDCRFLNEAKAIKNSGGIMLRIRRPGYKPVNNHISEVGLDGFSFDDFIDNDGTIEDLKYKVRCILRLQT